MILLGYDVETTGLDVNNDLVIEIGLTLYSTGLNRALDSVGQLVDRQGKTISPEVTKVTGITEAMCDNFGYSQNDAMNTVIEFAQAADAIVAYNGKRFDLPLTNAWSKRVEAPDKWTNSLFASTGAPKTIIDPFTDLPGAPGQELVTMCAKYGEFVNPFPHEAQMDERSTLKLLVENFDLEKVIERANNPTVVVLAHQKRSENDQAKKLKFRWNPNKGVWWKAVKEMDVQELANQASFAISIADKSITLEELQDS